MHRLESFLGRVFLALLVLAAAFVVADLVSRRFISSRSPIETQFPVQKYRHPRPYVMFGGKPPARRLNAIGYGDSVPAMPKPKGEFRVVVVGGSTVLLGDPAFPVLLEESFRARGCSAVRVYNFGVLSSVSGMETARLLFEVPDWDPDLVVMYNGANDLGSPLEWDPRPGYPFNFMVYENNPLLESDLEEYPALALFAYGSNIIRYLGKSYFVGRFTPLGRLRAEVGWGSGAWGAAVADRYVNNLAKAAKTAGAFGGRFIAFFQPVAAYRNSPSPEESSFARWQHVYFHAMRKAVRQRVEEAVATQSVRIVDLSGMFDDTPGWVFADFYHLKQESQGALAARIHGELTGAFDLPCDAR